MTTNVDRPRARSGQYAKHPACDSCGKPALDYCTDDEVCQGGDGPGFILCERARCTVRVAKVMVGLDGPAAVEARRALYTRQRAENEAARAEDRNPRAVAL